jgi:chemotaxis protein histidine kinase CheA
MHGGVHGGWHLEFARQQANHSPAASSSFQSSIQGNAPLYSPQANFQTPTRWMSPVAQQKQPEQSVDDVFDEAAFDKAFDAAMLRHETIAKESEEAEEAKETPRIERPEGFHLGFACTDPGDITGEYDFDQAWYKSGLQENDRGPSGATEAGHETAHQETMPRIGSDTIPAEDPRSKDESNADAEADELARTAGQLLDNLQHEQSEKFQNSRFLTLMRQLRDKEVKVEGDKMVEVNTRPRFGIYTYISSSPAFHGHGYIEADRNRRSSNHCTPEETIIHPKQVARHLSNL